MNGKIVRFIDKTQNVFIDAEEIDEKTIRLDISDAFNDSSTEVSVDRSILLTWCRDMLAAFDSSGHQAS